MDLKNDSERILDTCGIGYPESDNGHGQVTSLTYGSTALEWVYQRKVRGELSNHVTC